MIDHDSMRRRVREANPLPSADDLGEEDLAAFACAVEGRGMSREDSLPGRNAPAARGRGWRRPAWAFAAAFAAVIVAVGVTAWLLQGDTGQVAVDTPTTTLGAPQTTTEAALTSTTLAADQPTTEAQPSTTLAADQPTTEAQPSLPLDANALSWRRVALDPSILGETGAAINAVTVGGPGFVAVGTALKTTGCGGMPTCPHDAAVWTSPDGLNWSRVPHDLEVFGGEPWGTEEEAMGPGIRVMEDVTAGGPGLVAVGLRFDDPDAAVGLAAAVWTSSDGVNWSRVAYDETVFGSLFHNDPGESATWLKGVTAGGPGLVAVGTDAWCAAVWTSPDGITWTRVPHDPEVFGEGASWESHVELGNVTNAGPLLIATGFDDGYTSSALWTSTDGTTWSRVEVDDARYINDVTEGGPGFVAVGGYEDEPTGCHEGSFGDCYAAVWTSTDGVDWTQVPHDTVLFGGGDDKQMMHAVTRVGSDLVAVGTKVWVSPDGITWTVAYDDPQIVGAEQNGMYDIAVGPNSLVATTGFPDDAAVWVATPAE